VIDIHSHLLPGIDDGPATWEQTMAMVYQAIEDGIKEIAVTHHILSNVDYQREGEIIEKFEQLKQTLVRENLPLKLHLGSEIYSQPDMELQHSISTYNGNRKYFLVEFPMQGIPKFAADKFFEIIADGLTPVIAHPERNAGIIRKPERAYEFVQRGALLQLNGGSITGRHGSQVRDTAEILLNSNLFHLIGSDGHNTTRRPIRLSSALDIILDGWGTERVNLLFKENPRKVLNGDKIVPDEPTPPEPLKKNFTKRLKRFFSS
jgi:protein-tyrosine phosphatase